jgi:hypothetical protein
MGQRKYEMRTTTHVGSQVPAGFTISKFAAWRSIYVGSMVLKCTEIDSSEVCNFEMHFQRKSEEDDSMRLNADG